MTSTREPTRQARAAVGRRRGYRSDPLASDVDDPVPDHPVEFDSRDTLQARTAGPPDRLVGSGEVERLGHMSGRRLHRTSRQPSRRPAFASNASPADDASSGSRTRPGALTAPAGRHPCGSALSVSAAPETPTKIRVSHGPSMPVTMHVVLNASVNTMSPIASCRLPSRDSWRAQPLVLVHCERGTRPDLAAPTTSCRDGLALLHACDALDHIVQEFEMLTCERSMTSIPASRISRTSCHGLSSRGHWCGRARRPRLCVGARATIASTSVLTSILGTQASDAAPPQSDGAATVMRLDEPNYDIGTTLTAPRPFSASRRSQRLRRAQVDAERATHDPCSRLGVANARLRSSTLTRGSPRKPERLLVDEVEDVPDGEPYSPSRRGEPRTRVICELPLVTRRRGIPRARLHAFAGARVRGARHRIDRESSILRPGWTRR